MSRSLRLRLAAIAVFVVGIAMATAGGTASAWVWATPDAHPFFRGALPVLTLWLLITLVRLALALPGALRREREAGGYDTAVSAKKMPEVDPQKALAAAPRQAADAAQRRYAPEAAFVRQIVLPAEPHARWGGSGRRVVQRFETPDGRHLYRVAPVRRGRFKRRPAAARRVAVGAALIVVAIGLLFLLHPFDILGGQISLDLGGTKP